MDLKTFEIAKNHIKIKCGVIVLGDDLLVIIAGGKEHIGAIAVSIPRTSLKYKDRLSASTSIFTRISHKEDEIVKKVGDKVASSTGKFTTVVAGIHFDNITEDEISLIFELCEQIADRIIREVNKTKLS